MVEQVKVLQTLALDAIEDQQAALKIARAKVLTAKTIDEIRASVPWYIRKELEKQDE
jgi:hypothetical protein